MTTETQQSSDYVFDAAELWLVLVGLYPLFQIEHVDLLVRWLNRPPRSGKLALVEYDNTGEWGWSQMGDIVVMRDGVIVDQSTRTMELLYSAAARKLRL